MQGLTLAQLEHVFDAVGYPQGAVHRQLAHVARVEKAVLVKALCALLGVLVVPADTLWEWQDRSRLALCSQDKPLWHCQG